VQKIEVLKRNDKGKRLIEILQNAENQKVLIFVKTKITCDLLANYLINAGIKANSIHGDKK